METNKLQNLNEALLFFYNEPVTIKKLAKLLDATFDEINSALQSLKSRHQSTGLSVIVTEVDAQLVAIINDEDILNKIDKSTDKNQLTPAVLETLAVVLYLGSASEATIDSVRGVRSSRTLRRLLRRGYLDLSNEDYVISAEGLKQLGITNQSDIPDRDAVKLKLNAIANNEAND